MQSTIDQISQTVYRLSLYPDNGPICFNHFLILDERPALIHMGHRKTFDTLLALTKQLIDPSRIQYLAFSHYEGDESGALTHWLEVAPEAQVCVGGVCALSVKDEITQKPNILRHGESISLGSENLTLLETPHFPHNWEACLFITDKSQVLFGSDLGTQLGNRPAFTTIDHAEEIIDLQKKVGYLSYGPHAQQALDILQQQEVTTLATMHGSALSQTQYQSLLSLLRLENEAILNPDLSHEFA